MRGGLGPLAPGDAWPVSRTATASTATIFSCHSREGGNDKL